MAETRELPVEAKVGDSQPDQKKEAVNTLQSESENLRKSEVQPAGQAGQTRLVNETKDSAVVPALEIVDNTAEKPLSADEQRRVSFLQKQIVNIYSISQPRPENVSDEEFARQVKEGVEKIQQEEREGRFGPATKEAYKNMVTWIEKQAVPGAITELTRLQLPLPSGTPLELPADQYNNVVSVDYYKQLVQTGRITPNLKLDSANVPSDLEIEKIDDTMRWLKEVDVRALTARQEQQDRLLEKEITRLIPDKDQQEAWLDKRGSKPEEWRAAAIEAVDLATRVRNYVEAMDSLNRAGKRFGFEKPPGSEIVRDEKGRITQVKLDLPKDLRLDHPENKEKMENLRKWMADHGQEVDQALKELIKLEENPDRLLFWGEIDTPEGRVRLDQKGDISEFVDKENVDGSEKYYNLIDLEFDVEEKTGADGKKKIVISNDVQYRYSNWYNYLNIGADKIGNETKVAPREYDPEDWVPVRNGGKVEIMQAKDLASWRTRQQVFHYGEKALIATLDGAMLVTGTIQVGAAVKAARAGQLVLSQAAKQAFKGGLRATVGASGIVNNAYFQNTEIGQHIQTARGLYFVGDAALGLGAGSWRMLKNLRTGTEAASAAESASAIVEAQIKGSKWANRIYAPAEFGAKMTELPFAVVIGQDIYHQVDSLSEIGRNDPTRAALRQGKDGQGDQAPAEEKAAEIDPKKAKVAELDRYELLLQGEQSDPQVKEILEKTRTLLAGDATAEEIDRYKQELVSQFMPDGSQVTDRSSDMSHLQDKSGGFLKYAETKSRASQTAAALALLQLSRDSEGNLPDTLASREINIAEYKYSETVYHEYGSTEIEHTSPARTEKQDLKSSDIAAYLRREMVSPKAESKLVASSDLALQLGVASGREVAGVLEDVFTSDKTTDLEKSEAILRLGVTVDALKIQEAVSLDARDQFKEDSLKVGLSASAVENYLQNIALTAKNKDHRAAAAMMLYANGEGDSDTRQEMIKQYSRLLGESKTENTSEENSFSVKALNILKADMADESKGSERRLNAASAVLDLAGDDAELRLSVYRNLTTLMTPENVDLSRRVVEKLGAEGMKRLSESESRDDKKAANSVRETSMAIVSNTLKGVEDYSLDLKSEKDSAEFIKVLKPVIEGGEQMQKSIIEQSLIGLLDQNSSKFANFSPKLRIAAIQSLTEMGSRNAIPVLRDTLAGDPERKTQKDWDASVRYEAIKGLETLRDPKLRSLVIDLVGTESDPTVSSRLLDVKFTQERLDPSSEEYKKVFERTAAALMRDPFEGWTKLKEEVESYKKNLSADQKDDATKYFIRKWREENFPLLNGKTFNSYRDSEGDKAAEAVYAGFLGSLDWFFSYRSTIDKEEASARKTRRQEVTDSRDAQFERLIDRAALRNEDGMKAKLALIDILQNGGQPFASDESDWAQRKSAQAIRDLAKPGVENRDLIVWAVQEGLTKSRNMDHQARRYLAEALDQLATPDKDKRRAITREEAALTAASALDLQITQRAPYSADTTIESSLVKTIVANGHHKAYPVLEALVKEKQGTALGREAEDALHKMRDSVIQVWRDTAQDTTTTAAQRALNIEKALEDGNDAQVVIDAIFSAVKNQHTRDAQDPRFNMLRLAMNSTNERVRLAAAGSMIELGSYAGIDLSPALAVLQSIEKDSAVAGLKKDARFYLDLNGKVSSTR
ncbi:MAG: HEAT repeat domain-containing protein [Cyanobacteriota/Melainabacteria group bacterium]